MTGHIDLSPSRHDLEPLGKKVGLRVCPSTARTAKVEPTL